MSNYDTVRCRCYNCGFDFLAVAERIEMIDSELGATCPDCSGFSKVARNPDGSTISPVDGLPYLKGDKDE